MKASILPTLLAAILLAPAGASASDALDQAAGAAHDPAMFDGGRARPEASLVAPGAPADARTAAQIARDEQSLADARQRPATAVTGPDMEPVPLEPNEGLKGALTGMSIGSLRGLTGLGIGVLAGGLIGYALSRFAAKA